MHVWEIAMALDTVVTAHVLGCKEQRLCRPYVRADGCLAAEASYGILTYGV